MSILYSGVGGGSSGDSHNKGWFATPTALRTAYPTAEDGDYAIVGSTDTVWVWDTDTTDWKDTDTRGQVESVNGQTGTVVLDIDDVAPAQSGQSGKFLKTDGANASWATAITNVQVNGNSVVSGTIANIPKASTSTLGAVRIDGASIVADANGTISTPSVRYDAAQSLTSAQKLQAISNLGTAVTFNITYSDGSSAVASCVGTLS